MLKISILLVTTTAFAALLIGYPFSPQSAAQASGSVEQVAAAGPAKDSRRLRQHTGRTAVYLPSGGTLARHASGARTSARQTHRVKRYRSLALAPDQPTS
jgi:hypothetical protein